MFLRQITSSLILLKRKQSLFQMGREIPIVHPAYKLCQIILLTFVKICISMIFWYFVCIGPYDMYYTLHIYITVHLQPVHTNNLMVIIIKIHPLSIRLGVKVFKCKYKHFRILSALELSHSKMLKMELFSDKFYQEWDYLLLVLQDVIVVVLNKVSKYRSYKSSCTRKYLKEVFKSKYILFQNL